MWLIALLIIIGVFLLVAEIILLPGITVAALGAVGCYCGAAYVGYASYGVKGLVITVVIIIVASLMATWLSLRTRTWQRLSLKQNIDSASQQSPEGKLQLGDRGVAVTRLAPMGKVIVNGETYEAKAIDTFVDQQTEVEVTGFENFNIVVSPLKKEI